MEHCEGILQTDGYKACAKIGGAGIRRTCCLAHVRRKFYETLQVAPGSVEAGFILLKIGEIYAVEKEAREMGLDLVGCGRLRAERSVKRLGAVARIGGGGLG